MRGRLRTWAALMVVQALWLASAPMAQAEELPVVGMLKFTRRGDASVLSVSRIEEYVRQMMDAGGAVKLLPAKVVESGKAAPTAAAAAQGKDRPASPALKALDKADKLVQAARDVVGEAEPAWEDAGKLIEAAIQRYEQNFVELVDFTKLVDAYSLAAQVALQQGDTKASSDWLTKALTIQPSFVVDGRKQNRPLKELTDKARSALEGKATTELTVDCKDASAEVFVDGVKLGSPPAVAKDLAPGTHYVQVRKAGSLPWGQALVAKGKPLQVRAVLQADIAPEDAIGVSVAYDEVRDVLNKGSFGDKLTKNTAGLFAKQVGAGYLMVGLVNRRPSTLDLHLFLFNAKTKKTCAVEKVEYAANLTNLQMQTLDAEGKIRAALQSCSTEVVTTPPVFAGAVEEPAAAPEVVPAPPPPEPEPEVLPPPKPKPRVEPRPEPRVEPRPEPRPQVAASTDDPYANLLKEGEEPAAARPFYKTWWFWTGVGVLAAGAGAGIYLGTQAAAAPGGFSATIQLP